jgi:hypothetical protein
MIARRFFVLMSSSSVVPWLRGRIVGGAGKTNRPRR